MEPRGERRISYNCPITFFDEERRGQGTVVDISAGGWKVACPDPPRKGSYLSLDIHLPDQSEPLRVEVASVRWAAAKEFGVVFLRMEPRQQERMRKFLETFELA